MNVLLFRNHAINSYDGPRRNSYLHKISSQIEILKKYTLKSKRYESLLLQSLNSGYITNEAVLLRNKVLLSYINSDAVIRNYLFNLNTYLVKLGSSSYIIGRGCIIKVDPEFKYLMWSDLVGDIYDELVAVYYFNKSNGWGLGLEATESQAFTSHVPFNDLNSRIIPYLEKSSLHSLIKIGQSHQTGVLKFSRRLAGIYIPINICCNEDLKGFEKTLVGKAIDRFVLNVEYKPVDFIKESKISKIEGDNSTEITINAIEKFNEDQGTTIIKRSDLKQDTSAIEELL